MGLLSDSTIAAIRRTVSQTLVNGRCRVLRKQLVRGEFGDEAEYVPQPGWLLARFEPVTSDEVEERFKNETRAMYHVAFPAHQYVIRSDRLEIPARSRLFEVIGIRDSPTENELVKTAIVAEVTA